MRFAAVTLCVGAAFAAPLGYSRYAHAAPLEPPKKESALADLSNYDPDKEPEPQVPEDVDTRMSARKAEHEKMMEMHKADREKQKEQNQKRLDQKKEQKESEKAKKEEEKAAQQKMAQKAAEASSDATDLRSTSSSTEEPDEMVARMAQRKAEHDKMTEARKAD